MDNHMAKLSIAIALLRSCLLNAIRSIGRVVKTSVQYHEVSHQQAASVRILLELI
jgi:hypothetical protein